LSSLLWRRIIKNKLKAQKKVKDEMEMTTTTTMFIEGEEKGAPGKVVMCRSVGSSHQEE